MKQTLWRGAGDKAIPFPATMKLPPPPRWYLGQYVNPLQSIPPTSPLPAQKAPPLQPSPPGPGRGWGVGAGAEAGA